MYAREFHASRKIVCQRISMNVCQENHMNPGQSMNVSQESMNESRNNHERMPWNCECMPGKKLFGMYARDFHESMYTMGKPMGYRFYVERNCVCVKHSLSQTHSAVHLNRPRVRKNTTKHTIQYTLYKCKLYIYIYIYIYIYSCLL